MPLKYREGSIVAVPLRTSGYAPGVIARQGKEPILFGYFFAIRLDHPVLPEERLVATGAWRCMRFADLGLHKGTWPILGEISPWDRSDWPMPEFQQVRRDASVGLRIAFSEDEPIVELWRKPATLRELDGLPRAATHGSGAVEIVLTTALDPDYHYESPSRRECE